MFCRRSARRAAAALAACGGLLVAALFATEPAAADQHTRVDAATLADIGRIATEHHALGMYESERGPVVMLPRGSSVRSVAEAAVKTVPGVRTRYLTSRFSTADVDRISKRLTDRRWSPEAGKHGFTVMYDPESDRVAFGSTAPAAVKQAALRTSPGDIVARWVEVSPLASRYSDVSPFFGADAIDNQWGRCTSGANVVDSQGVPYAVTAAHCGGLTDDYNTGGAFGSKRWFFGSTVSRDETTDVAVIRNRQCGRTENGVASCFARRIFIGGANQDAYTNLKVTGSAGTFLRQEGLQVSGATTGITRGYAVTKNNANVCYGGTYPLNTCITSGRGIELGNPCCTATTGDSGGPVFFQPVNSNGTATIVGTVSGQTIDALGRRTLIASKFQNILPMGYTGVYR